MKTLDKMSGLYGFENDKIVELSNRQVINRIFIMISIMVGLLSSMAFVLFLMSKIGR